METANEVLKFYIELAGTAIVLRDSVEAITQRMNYRGFQL